MEQKMKLGILGTGMIVKEFLPWLAGADSPFQVQALCSTQRSAPLAAELCARYHVPQCTTNYLELLQWVDVVYLAVPNLQHTRYAKVALEAGKHVIVEKPMACTYLVPVVEKFSIVPVRLFPLGNTFCALRLFFLF